MRPLMLLSGKSLKCAPIFFEFGAVYIVFFTYLLTCVCCFCVVLKTVLHVCSFVVIVRVSIEVTETV